MLETFFTLLKVVLFGGFRSRHSNNARVGRWAFKIPKAESSATCATCYQHPPKDILQRPNQASCSPNPACWKSRSLAQSASWTLQLSRRSYSANLISSTIAPLQRINNAQDGIWHCNGNVIYSYIWALDPRFIAATWLQPLSQCLPRRCAVVFFTMSGDSPGTC